MRALSMLAVLAAPGALPAAARSDDDSAQVVLDWNLNALGRPARPVSLRPR